MVIILDKELRKKLDREANEKRALELGVCQKCGTRPFNMDFKINNDGKKVCLQCFLKEQTQL